MGRVPCKMRSVISQAFVRHFILCVRAKFLNAVQWQRAIYSSASVKKKRCNLKPKLNYINCKKMLVFQ